VLLTGDLLAGEHMKKVGGIFILFSLALGILIGLGIDAAQGYIARVLVETLEDEAKNAGGYTFGVDSVDVSLLTLSATARGPRIESNGKPALWFKRIDVRFGISEILDREISLNLTLRDGHSIGIDDESPTFRFIDSLTAPLPPERDRPDRLKIKLNTLKVVNSSFEQIVPVGKLSSNGVEATMARDAADNFVITPFLKTLTLALEDSSTKTLEPYTLGEVTGSLYLRDDALDFRELALTFGTSRVAGSASMGISNGQPISGSFGMSLRTDSFPFPIPLVGSLEGPLRLTKRASYPRFQGLLSNPTEQPLTLPFTPSVQLTWPKAQTEFEVERTTSGTRAALTKLALEGGELAALNTTPITLYQGNYSGSVSINAKTLTLGTTQLEGLTGTLSLGGTVDDPTLTVNASAQEVRSGGVALGPLDTTAKWDGPRIEFQTTQYRGPKLPGASAQLQATGAVRLGSTTLLEDTTITLANYAFGATVDEGTPSLSGRITARGPLTPSGITAQGNATIALPEISQPLEATLQLQDGKAIIRSNGFDGSLRAAATLDLLESKPSTVAVTATNLDISSIRPQLECASISGSLDYTFSLSTPATGSGSVALEQLAVGCKPYQISLARPVKLVATQGLMQIPALEVKSPSSVLTISGNASLSRGPSLQADGTLELATLIGFLPKVDTLSGTLTAHATVGGAWSAPTLNGSIALSGGTFGVESIGLAADRINGAITLDKERVAIQSLEGLINAGRFSVTGDAHLGDLGRSVLGLNFDHITIEPEKDVSLTASGRVELQRGESGAPRLAGIVTLEGGEIRQRFDLPSLVRILAESLVSRSRASVRKSELPNIELDIQLAGSRNLFLITNVAAGEFAASISIAGTLGKPLVSGEVKTLSGWVGLKNRRFEVTSGVLTFSPTSPAPTVELLGEAYLPSRTGENILAMLEVRGPLTGPKFKLSSDRGIPESQILQLLTQSGTALRGTRASSVSDVFEDSSQGLLEALTAVDLRRFWQGLTRIDSLAIEPVYNQLTGAIEPALVAEKKLARRLNLRGESTFGGTGSISRAKLVYDLARSLAVEGLIETDPTKRVNPLETNLILTILSRNPQFLKIAIDGNDEISSLNILEALRISESSRVLKSDLVRLEGALQSYYRDQGFLNAKVSATCSGDEQFCKALKLAIHEGEAFRIKTITTSGDSLPDSLRKQLRDVVSNDIATARALERLKQSWISSLRNEGYIGARVFAEYRSLPGSAEVELDMDITLGRPVALIFRGNTAFSPADFLETINLFKRKQPFGNNTIAILTQNMERLYREAGYLYASISYQRVEDPLAERVTYLIDIVEEQKVKVASVQIEGVAGASVDQIKKLLTQSSPELAKEIFEPQAAVSEELEFHSRDIEAALISLGFPEATVEAEIEATPDTKQVRIIYRVTEGAPLRLDAVTIEGLPAELHGLPALRCPCAVPMVNEYVDAVKTAARDAGFLAPSQSIALDLGTRSATILIEPGSRTVVGAIRIEGNRGIKTETITSTLHIHSGEPWRTDKIDESRRELLRLGVFSRVDIGPFDGQLDGAAEDLRITVVERPLQTLEVGAGANSEYGLHLFGEASDRGLFADGRSLALRFDTYWSSLTSEITQGVADLRFTNPKFLSTTWTHTENLRFQRLDLPTLPYNLDRVSVASYLTRANDDAATISLGHTIFQENLNDVDPGAILSDLDTGLVRLSLLGGTISYDRRDNPLNPSAGFYGAFDYRIAARAIGSDADFHSITGSGSFIEPLPFISPALRFAFNTRAASSWTFGASPAIPISQRYFLGGRTTVRGFKENSLGPRADDDSVIGGDVSLLANTELRYSLTDTVAAHLFVDSGSVYLRDRGVSLGDLRYSTGAGVRYLSPIGPVGFEVGCPLDRQSGEPAYRVHFTIGNNF